MAWLIAKGCSEMQGYYYAKPVPGSEALEVIRKINAK